MGGERGGVNALDVPSYVLYLGGSTVCPRDVRYK